ncbi:MAG TPA: GNAT family N-acetyltransferase [Acidimicrobiales bacterium]|nr:GNAT family N-acetyltransferase [Acidimicrobiales bacterium]
MGSRPADDSLEVVVADASETSVVLDLLNEAASWLTACGIRQWPASFTPAILEPGIRAGETWLARQGDDLVGTVTLSWSDPAWPEALDDAGYVHRLAVPRRGTGLGQYLLGWAAAQVTDRGRSHLRLDCVATNRKLRRYYERLGFAYWGDTELFGAPGERLSAGTPTLVSLYELVVSG